MNIEQGILNNEINQPHGLVSINNSSINNADIAILSGKRDTSFVWGYDPWYNGGVIQVDNDTFENNYIDIMFEDWNVGGICTCSDTNGPRPIGRVFHHSITNSYFGKMKETGHCTNWLYANERIDSVQFAPDKYDTSYAYIYEKCHIVDLTPYWMVSATYPIGGYTYNWCNVAIQYKNVTNVNPNFPGNATYNNSYYEDPLRPNCGCPCTPPFDNFH